MIDVTKLLNAVLTGGATPSDHHDAPQRAGGFLQGGDAANTGGASTAGGGLFSVPEIFGQGSAQNFGQGGAQDGGGIGGILSRNAGMLGTGAVAGGLAGILLNSKRTRKYAGKALKVGAAAVLGGLAYKAYQNYRAGRPVIPENLSNALGQGSSGGADAAVPSPSGAPMSETERCHMETLLLRAAIAAAMADGRIDERERIHLVERVEASELSDDERVYLEGLIAKPETPQALAASVRSPEEAAQVYLAAYIAIDADTPDERFWLDDLANRLRLDPQLRENIETAARESLEQAS